jgi:hypothetical protein
MSTRLLSDGFSISPSSHFRQEIPGLFDPEFRELIESEVKVLEPDVVAGGYGRFRRHSKALLFPDTKNLVFLAPQEGKVRYNQGAYNPEYNGVARALNPISGALLAHSVLAELVWHNFAQTDWSAYQLVFPLCVGFSIIRFFIPEDVVGFANVGATPDALHQDGEVFTFAHLIERRNVEGGENVIAGAEFVGKHPSCVARAAIKATFTLREYFDSYVVFDPMVSHHVNGVSRHRESQSAARAVLLIDFTPIKLIHQ